MSATFINRLATRRGPRILSVYLLEVLVIALSGVIAFMLRLDLTIPPVFRSALILSVLVWLPVKLLFFKLYELDRRWARYIALRDLLRLSLSNLCGSVVSCVFLVLMQAGTPRTVFVIDFGVCVVASAAIRISVRMVAESGRTRVGAASRKRVLIYGAGDAGTALLRDIRQNPTLRYEVCGFVDDDEARAGLVLHGVKVLGPGAALDSLVGRHAIALILIAVPSASGAQMKTILERCNEAAVPYKTVPGLAELIDGDLSRQIREVAVEDLLGRSPVQLEQDRIFSKLQGRVILVTGAAGSIGSEICRQLARFEPAAIVGFEIAESPLFSLAHEMGRLFPGVQFHAEIGSIQNTARLNEVFATHQPSVVYHAAAYKHVPLMEAHLFEAIENNVFGTLNVVETARQYRVRDFVMISSDKAVRPTNVMGATKRIAELLVRSLQPQGASYVSVRFGNVLGSNGSVVPIFKEQIARGGPVTVTDPEMRRYFMTIPEACQLVLQASTMGNGCEIFVLDMGEPVKIVDLARNMILLSGLRPEEDIRIEFVGARPGEKLYEELNMDEEGLLHTHHEKINVFEGATEPWTSIERRLRRLRESSRERDAEDALALIAEFVPDYRNAKLITAQA